MGAHSSSVARRAFCLSAAIGFFGLGVSARAQSAAAPDKKEDLSDKLNKSNGIIKPREDVDPGMTKPTPPVSEPIPVVPPPGSPGGDPNVHPK